jgi:DNA-binding transcriptional ArsR family regulator
MDTQSSEWGGQARQQQMAGLFRALGDPVRLEMVRRLSTGAPSTIGALSAGFSISRQGARKHLQVLASVDLVSLEPSGRDVLVRLDPETLDLARAFIGELEKKWDSRLQALKRFVEEG